MQTFDIPNETCLKIDAMWPTTTTSKNPITIQPSAREMCETDDVLAQSFQPSFVRSFFISRKAS